MTNEHSTSKSNYAFIVYLNPLNEKKETLELGRKSEILIGRANFCDIVLDNPDISRVHCILRYNNDGEWVLSDASTTSGTYVNGERMPTGSSRVLNCGDLITLSGPCYQLKFYFSKQKFMRKRKQITDDASSISSKRIKNEEENILENLGKEICSRSLISLCSGQDQSVNLMEDKDAGMYDEVDGDASLSNNDNNKTKLKNGHNDNDETNCEINKENCVIIKKEEKPKDSDLIQLELEKLQSKFDLIQLNWMRSKLMERTPSDTKEIQSLKLEVQVLVSCIKLNNETIDDLKKELTQAKRASIEQDREQNMTEGRHFVAEQNEINEDGIKNEGMIKMIMTLVENELQCGICHEIIIEASVIFCSHQFCFFCINEWKKNNNKCPLCRGRIKNLVKSRALDSFIEKMLAKYSSNEILNRRKEIAEDRKKIVEEREKILTRPFSFGFGSNL